MINFDNIIKKEHKNNILVYIKSVDFYSLNQEETEEFKTYLSSQDSNQLNAIYLTMALHKSKMIYSKHQFIDDLELFYLYTKIMPFIETIFSYESLKDSLQHIEVKKTSTIKI